jgi:hypothetical protein
MMRGAVTIGDLLAALSGERIKPLISRQEFATMAFEVMVATKMARYQLGYHPVITMDEGMSQLKARYRAASMRSAWLTENLHLCAISCDCLRARLILGQR